LRLRQEALHNVGPSKVELPAPPPPNQQNASDSDSDSDAGKGGGAGGGGSDSDSDSMDKIDSFVKSEKSFFDSALSDDEDQDDDEERGRYEAKKTIATASTKTASKLSPPAPSALKFATKTFDSDSEDDEDDERGGAVGIAARGGGGGRGGALPKGPEEKEDLVMSFDDDFDD
jgi:hypothetical protein